MGPPLHDWLRCPSCDSANVGTLAYRDTISLECYDCTEVSALEIGEDVPVRNLDPEAFGPDGA